MSAASRSGTPPEGSQAKVLMVDDRPENLLALEAILEPLGYTLIRAGSGEDALKQVLRHDFAVILLDVQMPGLNGFETAELIKSRPRSHLTPVIFLTAISKETEYVFRGYSVGAVDYLSKPFEPVVLRSKVAVFVELYLKREQLKRQEAQLRQAELREAELRHRAELREREVASAAELQEMNAQLQQRQEELEEAIASRSRFYASMSHELRTPINAIMGYNALLLDHIHGPLNPKQAHSLQRTQKAARHLLDLVNDILDLSKIEAGKLELHPEPVSVAEVVQELFVTVGPLAEERGSSLHVTPPTGVPIVVTDPRRLRQILLNLLSNAIKFGQGEPIEVHCRGHRCGGVEVEVRDHGLGIAPEQQGRIFEEFVQLEDLQEQGTGLGLPISRRLAQLLRGALEVESEVGAGSTFRLVLPHRLEITAPA